MNKPLPTENVLITEECGGTGGLGGGYINFYGNAFKGVNFNPRHFMDLKQKK
jgi:hypothetical protein